MNRASFVDIFGAMLANTDSDHSDDASFKSAEGDKAERPQASGEETVNVKEDAPAQRLTAGEEAVRCSIS